MRAYWPVSDMDAPMRSGLACAAGAAPELPPGAPVGCGEQAVPSVTSSNERLIAIDAKRICIALYLADRKRITLSKPSRPPRVDACASLSIVNQHQTWKFGSPRGMANSRCGSLKLEEQILDTWRINNRINLYM